MGIYIYMTTSESAGFNFDCDLAVKSMQSVRNIFYKRNTLSCPAFYVQTLNTAPRVFKSAKKTFSSRLRTLHQNLHNTSNHGQENQPTDSPQPTIETLRVISTRNNSSIPQALTSLV